ncbi:MAG: hypothetical protein ABI927_02695 [Gaiellaceae bacterium]
MKAVAVLLGLLAVACTSVSTTAAVARSALRLVDSSPITVQGIRFKPHELVRVTFTQGLMKQKRAVRATTGGRFSASAGDDMRLDRCGDLLLVTAVGGRGSRAWLKRPLPECPPAP